jgi:hypothetical protein
MTQTQVCSCTATTYTVNVNWTGTTGAVNSGVFTATRIA